MHELEKNIRDTENKNIRKHYLSAVKISTCMLETNLWRRR